MRNRSFPEKTCSIDRLVRQPQHIQAAVAGRKTQQRRAGVYGHPGERFQLEGVEFEITDLRQQPLGEMTDADAQAEGYESLEAYRAFILGIHPGMSWNEESVTWVHTFRRTS